MVVFFSRRISSSAKIHRFLKKQLIGRNSKARQKTLSLPPVPLDLHALHRQLHRLLRRRDDRVHARASHEGRGRSQSTRRRRRLPHPRRTLHDLLPHRRIREFENFANINKLLQLFAFP